jgi:5-formyltetrahydrofolate cyclo-ligase
VPALPPESPDAPRPALDRTASAKVLAAKRELRARIVGERDAKSAKDRATASDAIALSLSLRTDFASSATVLLTLPFGSEWDTRNLLAAATSRNKTIALPRVNRATGMLDLFAILRPEEDVVPGYRGIPEPAAHCSAIDIDSIDWVLVPGVAFDRFGHRVGYGGGYYDRLLPRLPSRAHRVAGAFELQLVGRVPAAAHDVRIDAVVTEMQTVEIAR